MASEHPFVDQFFKTLEPDETKRAYIVSVLKSLSRPRKERNASEIVVIKGGECSGKKTLRRIISVFLRCEATRMSELRPRDYKPRINHTDSHVNVLFLNLKDDDHLRVFQFREQCCFRKLYSSRTTEYEKIVIVDRDNNIPIPEKTRNVHVIGLTQNFKDTDSIRWFDHADKWRIFFNITNSF